MRNLTEQQFLDKLRSQLGEPYGGIPLRPDVTLDHRIADAGAEPFDDLDEVEFVMAVEDVFGVEIPDEVAWQQDDTGSTSCATLRVLYDYVVSH